MYSSIDPVSHPQDDSEGEETPLLRSPWIWKLPRGWSRVERQELFDSVRYQRATRRTLNTFSGVFCPVALSMFSTVLFLREGFVVGQAGILECLAQFLLAYLILVLTVFSICAISTNGAVEGGGAYFMISRALGPEFGGSIGFLFFVANILACGLYVIGFVEGILENFGQGGMFVPDGAGLPDDSSWWKYLYCTIVLLLCLAVCLIGGAMFARTLAIILLILVICIVSVIISIFAQNKTIEVNIPTSNGLIYTGNESSWDNKTANYTGLSAKTFRENLYSDYTEDYSTGDMMSFAAVFAVLFSSVTGIMNGANMSGELKDPGHSIPKGTLSAIGFTFCTYVIVSILISGSCQRYLLVNNYIFLQEINLWPPFVLIGIFAATLSAALGNLIGASRILEALANDNLFWFALNPAKVTTRGGNPYIAVLMSWFLVQLVMLVGDLNTIAPITSIFFLLSYASTNLACLALDLASAPNFRPTFKYFTWHTSLLGLIGCMIMCFLINAIYSSVAIIVMLLVIIMLHLRSLPMEWGSISQALIFHQVRKYLLMLDLRKAHVKYWRPQILLMVAHPRQCCELMDFINDIKKGGLYIIGHVQIGSLDEHVKDPLAVEHQKWLSLVDHLKIKAFVETTLAKTVSEGLQQLLRLAGLGGMKPNTVCFGFFDSLQPVDTLAKTKISKKKWFGAVEAEAYSDADMHFKSIRSDDSEKTITDVEYVKLIIDSLKLHKNVCLCRHFNQLNKKVIINAKGTTYIDVWPVNLFRPDTANFFDNTCLFMLQLACILNMVPGWKSKTCLRVFLCVNAVSDNTLQKEQKLDAFLRQLRIIAKIQMVTWDHLTSQLEDPTESMQDSGTHMQEYNSVSKDYIHSLNQLLVSHSSRTAVTFLYLPRAPQSSDLAPQYIMQLEELSNNLPPTVFVHGLHPVTSTTL